VQKELNVMNVTGTTGYRNVMWGKIRCSPLLAIDTFSDQPKLVQLSTWLWKWCGLQLLCMLSGCEDIRFTAYTASLTETHSESDPEITEAMEKALVPHFITVDLLTHGGKSRIFGNTLYYLIPPTYLFIHHRQLPRTFGLFRLQGTSTVRPSSEQPIFRCSVYLCCRSRTRTEVECLSSLTHTHTNIVTDVQFSYQSHTQLILLWYLYHICVGLLCSRSRDGVVGIATRYGLEGPGIESRSGTRLSAPIPTGSEAHPASCTMDTASFPG
jgi:hypothetical protein